MGIQACGVANVAVAKSLAGNLFMNDFLRFLKVSRQDIRDTFKTLEKRSGNKITIKPHTENVVEAHHHWVGTCFWLNDDPEQAPFPTDDADAVLA